MKKFLLSTRLRRGYDAGSGQSFGTHNTVRSRLKVGWPVVILLLLALLPMGMKAEMYDDTHYGYCIMDDVWFTDSYAKSLFDQGSLNKSSCEWIAVDALNILHNSNKGSYEVHFFCEKLFDSKYRSSLEIKFRHLYTDRYDYRTFYIDVKAPSGVGISNLKSNEIVVGENSSFTIKLLGSFPKFVGNGYFDYKITSTDTNIFTIRDKGDGEYEINALKPGTASIKASVSIKNSKYNTSLSYDLPDVYKSITVKEPVKEVYVDNIILSHSELSLIEGEKEEIKATVSPADATNQELTWTSSDPSVATVRNGIVTAVSKGTATITCTANDGRGVSASCSVMVLPYNPVPASEIEGDYQFFLGDFFRNDDSLGMIVGPGSIKIDGKSALLEIDILNGKDILAYYNEESGSLIFTQKVLGEVMVDENSYFCRFEPFVCDEAGWAIPTNFFVSYDKTRESFVFPKEQGFVVAAYADAECTQYEGFLDMYIVSALIKDTEAEGNWIDYDTATYVDGWILPSGEYDPQYYPWSVSVQQNIDNPNLFRISHPYESEGCPIRDYVLGKGYIVFDLSDPENVMVPTGHYCGMISGQNLIEVTNSLGYNWRMYGDDFESYAELQDAMSSWNIASNYDRKTGTVSFNDCRFIVSGDENLFMWKDKESLMNGKLVFDNKRPGVIVGDADNNGKVDIGDAVVICNHYVGKTDDINEAAADVTCDGRVDVQDAIAVCNIYLGKNNPKKSKQIKIKRNENQKVYDCRSLRPLGSDGQRLLRHHGERITQGVVH